MNLYSRHSPPASSTKRPITYSDFKKPISALLTTLTSLFITQLTRQLQKFHFILHNYSYNPHCHISWCLEKIRLSQVSPASHWSILLHTNHECFPSVKKDSLMALNIDANASSPILGLPLHIVFYSPGLSHFPFLLFCLWYKHRYSFLR